MQDWFAKEHTICDIIAAAARRWCVKTATEFRNKLINSYPTLAKKFPSRGTLRGWFTFAGEDHAARYPTSLITWREGYTSRYNVRMRQSAGRKPKLAGCEEALDAAQRQLQATRGKHVPVTGVTARSVLIAHLIDQGHADRLSPHLLDIDAAKDNTKFVATSQWVAQWLHGQGLSYRAVTGSNSKLPEDWEARCEASLTRIAGKCAMWEIPPDRVVMGDQTFVNLGFKAECAPNLTFS